MLVVVPIAPIHRVFWRRSCAPAHRRVCSTTINTTRVCTNLSFYGKFPSSCSSRGLGGAQSHAALVQEAVRLEGRENRSRICSRHFVRSVSRCPASSSGCCVIFPALTSLLRQYVSNPLIASRHRACLSDIAGLSILTRKGQSTSRRKTEGELVALW